MYSLIKPLLFRMDAEKAHETALSALRYVPRQCFASVQGRPVQAMGLTFPHAVGLAAGLDKNGAYLDALAKLGFAFIELGTVTPRPQAGNPKPRLFRIPKAHALINRMGFNNQGVDALVAHVQKARYTGILGINIGKNKDTPLNRAAEDYIACLKKVYAYASYITINISSPNTPDLRQLQQAAYFSDLLAQVQKERLLLTEQHKRHVPLLIKVSPDEGEETLKQMVEAMVTHGIEGIIATNTTCSREKVSELPYGQESGGLSGAPLADLSTACLRLLKRYVGDEMTLIGVGGIENSAGAQAKIDAGASLVQVYSGLIYQGPGLVHQIVSGLD